MNLKSILTELFWTTLFSAVFLAINFVMPAAFLNQSQNIERSFQIISTSYEALGTLMDCETGYRGYMLTKNVSFLEPQIECVCHINEQLYKLKRFCSDNPSESELLPQMEDIANRKVKLSRQAVSFDSASNEDRAVMLSKGKELMDQYRVNTHKLISVESEILQARQTGMNDIRNVVYLIRFVLSAAMVGLLTHITYRIKRLANENSANNPIVS